MTKEEILERSRDENKGKDVVEEEFVRRGFMVCWIVAVVSASIVAVVEGIVLGRQNSGIFFTLMSALFSFFIMKFVRFRKRHELIATISYGIAAVCFFIVWVISLVNG